MKYQLKTEGVLLPHSVLVIFLAISALIGIYPHVRSNFHVAGGGDSQRFSGWIASLETYQTLDPADGPSYPNGYGYQTLAVAIKQIGGLSIADIQLYVGTLLIFWTIWMAWLFYREVTQSGRAAAIALLILFTQSELLFSLLRGTHEKFTRGLMFLCLYLLVRSIRSRQEWRRFAALLLAFYLASYALITFNNLMASSFIVAMGLALGLSLAVRQLVGSQGDASAATRRRLLYAVGVSLVLAFLFTFYAYAPARQALLTAGSILDRLALLFLDVEEIATNPYQTVGAAWISLPVYLLVSIANWLLLIFSFALWARQTLTWWRNRAWPEEPRAIVLWSLYGAFGLLGALSVAIDFSGALSSNLQHRIFPSFAMVAAAVVADWFARRQTLRPPARGLVYGAMAAGIAFLGIVAVAKATNEPALSNKWNYYAPAEFAALDWSRDRYPDAPTWAAFDERLRAAIGICCAWEEKGAQFDSYEPDPGTRNYLISDVIRARGERLGLPLPVAGDSLRVYDSGAAEIYHLRPRTPFQK